MEDSAILESRAKSYSVDQCARCQVRVAGNCVHTLKGATALGLHETMHMAQEDRQCIVGSPVLWPGNRCTVVRLLGDRRIAITAGQERC